MAFDFQALAQKGKYFHGGNNVGIDPDATIPTTTAKVALVNVASDGQESLIIDSIHFYLVSGTAAAGATLIYGVTVGKVASPPSANAANNLTWPTRGLISTSSRAFFQAAATVPATAVWVSANANFQLAAANIGQGSTEIKFAGTLIVPPGYGLHLGIFSAAGTTPKYGYGVRWGEQVLTLSTA